MRVRPFLVQAAGIVLSVSGALVLVHVENLDFHQCAFPFHFQEGQRRDWVLLEP